ncbi:MAG: phosphoribosylanthranilate isomerase [Desulfomonilaceae bacterium]|nr:phosphoribosylanthranilate isomerase [Desulfomonilaceae bacterium]
MHDCPHISFESQSWCPRVQVAGVSSLEEALFCRAVGVGAVGFTLELPSGTHDGLTKERARAIIDRLPRDLLAVLITYLDSAVDAARLVDRLNVRAIQFHGDIADEQVRLFRSLRPAVRTIGRITVSGPSALDHTNRVKPPLWDAVILDSFDPASGALGATGITHDWSLSARIVRRSSVPVILAGGLNPENVAAAIAAVRPHGVDAHTGLENPDGSRNFQRIEAFSKAALEAFGTTRS